MKFLLSLPAFFLILISSNVSSEVVITETETGSAVLSDSSTGVRIELAIENNTTSDIFAFAVGNNTADGASIGFTADGEWSGFTLLTRPDTNSDWSIDQDFVDRIADPETGPEPFLSGGNIDISWLSPSDLPGDTRAFYFENIQDVSANVAPGESLGFTRARFIGTARSAASPFAARGINPDGSETTFSGETVNPNAVAVPTLPQIAAYLLFTLLIVFGLITNKKFIKN